jgi:transposase
MTLQCLREQYIDEHSDGCQNSAYCRDFYRWRATDDVTMYIEYGAGKAMLVHRAGDKLLVINGRTGKPWALEQFVPILGAGDISLASYSPFAVGSYSLRLGKNRSEQSPTALR